ncbi:hypothetical protein ACFLVO_03945 [Chloroflexota bacterium]
MRKLVCDRCGLELTDIDDIDLAFEGKETWATSCRERGVEPRGILPCKNYIRCGGEIVLGTSRRRRLVKYLLKR